MPISVYPEPSVSINISNSSSASTQIADTEGNVVNTLKEGNEVSLEVADLESRDKLDQMTELLKQMVNHMEEINGDSFA